MKSIRTKLREIKKPISAQSKLFAAMERRHIQAHLALTELRLRRVRNAATPQDRHRLLDILHRYWRAGVFPVNTYQKGGRVPVFIDAQGVHCAVGYLMAQTGHGELARAIDVNDKFALVEQLNTIGVDAWLRRYGLKQEEAALIQPTYGEYTLERVAYTYRDIMMAWGSLAACAVLIACVTAVFWLYYKKRTLPRTTKQPLYLVFGGAIVVSLASFFVLSSPSSAIEVLRTGKGQGLQVECPGWNTPISQRPAICNDYKQKGSLPAGWHEIKLRMNGLTG